MSPDFIFAYVLDHAAQEPASRRIQLYRGLAKMSDVGGGWKRELVGLAESLETAEARHAELALKFNQSHAEARP